VEEKGRCQEKKSRNKRGKPHQNKNRRDAVQPKKLEGGHLNKSDTPEKREKRQQKFLARGHKKGQKKTQKIMGGG